MWQGAETATAQGMRSEPRCRPEWRATRLTLAWKGNAMSERFKGSQATKSGRCAGAMCNCVSGER